MGNSVSLANAAKVSYCVPSPGGPLFDSLSTEELLPCIPRETNETQCRKLAYVTAAPSISFVISGAAASTAPMPFAANDTVQMSQIVWDGQFSGDIMRQMPQIAEFQARLAAVLFGQVFMQGAMADPALAAFNKNFRYFASLNPLGVSTPSKGVGSLPTVDDLLCLRRSIQPHPASSDIVFAMRSDLLDALSRTAYQDGRPLQYQPDPVTGETHPSVAGIPILVSDNISTAEALGGGTTSIYAIRLKNSKDPAGIEGVSIVSPPGAAGVQVSPLTPLEDGTDTYSMTVKYTAMLLAGSRTSVARSQGYAVS